MMLADKVLSERAGGTRRAVDVQQWTLTASRQRVIDGEVVLNDLIASRLQRLQRQLDRLGSGGAVIGTSQPPEDDSLSPAAPTGVTADSSAYQEGADTVAVLIVGWAAVTTNSDASAADDIAGYRVEYAYSAEPNAWMLGADVSGLTANFGSLTAGVDVRVRVRAYDRDGNVSAPSTVVELTTETDNNAPPSPSAPIVTTRVSILAAEWDGLGSAGEAMPLDLDFVEVHISAASNFTPDATTYYDRLGPGGGVMPITGRAYGAATFVRLIAVDKSTPTPNRSGPSVQGSATPQPVVSADIFDGAVGTAQLANLAVTNAKIDLLAVNAANIGSVNAGTIVSGTVSALLTLSGIIRTDVSPNRRMEITSNGFSAYDTSNVLWAELNLTTRSMLVTGTYLSGTAGERIRLDPDGSARWYAASGTDYASIENDGADLMFRSRADGSGRRSYITYTGNGLNISWGTSSVRYSGADFGVTYGVLRAGVCGVRMLTQYATEDSTEHRFHVLHANSSGDIGGTVWHFRRDSDNRGVLHGAGSDAGIKPIGGVLWITKADGSTFAPCRAESFLETSSLATKRGVLPMQVGVGMRAVDLVKQVRICEWERAAPNRPDRPGHKLRRTEMVDGVEREWWVDAEWDWAEPGPRKQYGPIAEELEAVAPSLVVTDHITGDKALDVLTVASTAWAAAADNATDNDRQDAEIAGLRAELAALRRRLPTLAAPVVIEGEVA